jgi:hypothetical protein
MSLPFLKGVLGGRERSIVHFLATAQNNPFLQILTEVTSLTSAAQIYSHFSMITLAQTKTPTRVFSGFESSRRVRFRTKGENNENS